MNPKHLPPKELATYARIVGETSKDFLVQTEWVRALTDALDDELGASEDVQKELDEALDCIKELEGDLKDLTQRIYEAEEELSTAQDEVELLKVALEEAQDHV